MSMPIETERPAVVPLYRQVKEILIGRIARGDWRPGEQLPAEPRLAEELGVSAGTVRKALDEMAAEALVTRRQGSGTYVATASAETSLFRFFKLVNTDGERVMPSSKEAGREVGWPSPRECEVLSVGRRDKVVRVRRVRFSGRTPIMTETVVLPTTRMEGIETHTGELPNTLYDFYQAAFGVTVRRVEETLRAVMAEADDAALFGIAAGTPLLEIERRTFSFGPEPVEYRLSRLDSRAFAYRSELE